MKYEVGARVRLSEDGIGFVTVRFETPPRDGIVTIMSVDEDDDVLPYDIEWSDGRLWVAVDHIDPTPVTKQDALNRLLAEHKERKAALTETTKAITSMFERNKTIVRLKRNGELRRVTRIKPSLWVHLTNLDGTHWEYTTVRQIELIDSGGETP